MWCLVQPHDVVVGICTPDDPDFRDVKAEVEKSAVGFLRAREANGRERGGRGVEEKPRRRSKPGIGLPVRTPRVI